LGVREYGPASNYNLSPSHISINDLWLPLFSPFYEITNVSLR
jgi:hypothetical protein